MPEDDPIERVLAAERPLSARTVLVLCLLGSRRSEVPGRDLITAAGLLGVGEGAVRTALSRMVAAGEVVSVDGVYELVGIMRDRRADQAEDRTVRVDWDGTWELQVVQVGRRSADERTMLRTAAARLRLAELREGVWTRPRNLVHNQGAAERAVVAEQCAEFVGTPAADPAALAAELWELQGWSEHGGHLARSVDPALAELRTQGRNGLRTVFLLQVAIRGHLESDPMLPDELLPASWPGEELRSGNRALHTAFRDVLVPIIRARR